MLFKNYENHNQCTQALLWFAERKEQNKVWHFPYKSSTKELNWIFWYTTPIHTNFENTQAIRWTKFRESYDVDNPLEADSI